MATEAMDTNTGPATIGPETHTWPLAAPLRGHHHGPQWQADLPPQSTLHCHHHGPSWQDSHGGIFLIDVPASQITLACVKLALYYPSQPSYLEILDSIRNTD